MSVLALGTVALGVDYGIEVAGDFGRPAESDALCVLRQAADAGINLFDTAPAYGESERLLGLALARRHDCFIATKVSLPRDADGGAVRGARLQNAVFASVDASLRSLRRDSIDIVQVHNATLDLIAEGDMLAALELARERGKVRILGASVYTEAEALAVVASGGFDVLQVAYNLLDQQMASRLFPTAERAGIGVILRSALLKGVLTARAQWLPGDLARLRQAAEVARDRLAGSWESLPEMALRFCLSAPDGAVLIGARTSAELAAALAAAEKGPLSPELLARAPDLALDDRHLLNPSYWPIQ